MAQKVSRKEYYDSLPRKRGAVGVLIMRDNQLLIVKPTYRPEWLVPGGIIEQFESPYEAAKRECIEEIGVSPQITRLLVVDYKRGDSEIGDAIHYIFEATLDSDDKISVDGKEIEKFDWEPLQTAPQKFGEHLSKRVIAAQVAINRNMTVFCEDGEIRC